MPKLFNAIRQSKHCLRLVISLSALFSVQAYAHAGHNDLIQLRVNDQQLGMDIGLNAADFMQFDQNQDGQLTRQEFVEQQDAIKQWLQTQIQIKTEQASLKPTWFDLPLEVETEDLNIVKHVRLIQRYELPAKAEVKFQSQLPSFKGKGLMFSSEGHFYMKKLSSSPVEILVQAVNTD